MVMATHARKPPPLPDDVHGLTAHALCVHVRACVRACMYACAHKKFVRTKNLCVYARVYMCACVLGLKHALAYCLGHVQVSVRVFVYVQTHARGILLHIYMVCVCVFDVGMEHIYMVCVCV
jgi:hypothetical protein